MQEFSVGDKVIYTSGRFGTDITNPLYKQNPNIYGVITDITPPEYEDDLNIWVEWSNGQKNEYSQKDLQHLSEYHKQKSQLKI